MKAAPLTTPDGRYLVVRGRLWRTSNPGLDDSARQAQVNALMAARRAVRTARQAADEGAEAAAHAAVDVAKQELGERGPAKSPLMLVSAFKPRRALLPSWLYR